MKPNDRQDRFLEGQIMGIDEKIATLRVFRDHIVSTEGQTRRATSVTSAINSLQTVKAWIELARVQRENGANNAE